MRLCQFVPITLELASLYVYLSRLVWLAAWEDDHDAIFELMAWFDFQRFPN